MPVFRVILSLSALRSEIASFAAIAAARLIRGIKSGFMPLRGIHMLISSAPSVLSHTLPRLPLPAVCSSAIRTDVFMPNEAFIRRFSSVFVESTVFILSNA